MTAINERVAVTEAWLDATIPEWDAQIDLARLDMASCRQCIGGQIKGNYFVFARIHDLGRRPAVAAGLNGEYPDEYPLLTETWRKRIAQRRAARLAPEPEAGGV